MALTHEESKRFAVHVIHDVLNEKSTYRLLGNNNHKGIQHEGQLGVFYPCMRRIKFSNNNSALTAAAKASKVSTRPHYLIVDNQYKFAFSVQGDEVYKFRLTALEGRWRPVFAMNCELTLLNQFVN